MDLETNPDKSNSCTIEPLSSFVWVWGIPLSALLALAILLATGANIALFQMLNQLTSKAGDGWWSHLSALGDVSLALMFVLPLFGRRPEVVWQFFL